MQHTVQGLGGAFLYVNDLQAIAAWYTEHLGLELQDWGSTRGLAFPSTDLEPSERMSPTVFSLFQADTPLGPERTGRVNFRVSDLDGLLGRLEAAGMKVERHPDESFGRFAWTWDPEGNKVELWEPPLA